MPMPNEMPSPGGSNVLRLLEEVPTTELLVDMATGLAIAGAVGWLRSKVQSPMARVGLGVLATVFGTDATASLVIVVVTRKNDLHELWDVLKEGVQGVPEALLDMMLGIGYYRKEVKEQPTPTI